MRFGQRRNFVFREDLAAKVAEYAAMKPNPVSLHSWLGEFAEPVQLAEFLCTEMPIRYAERIRNIAPWL